jgi:LuxR family maltose regulon positive regulatory protein
VTGPAGSGKSVLLGGWVRKTASLTAVWMSLNCADNNPRRFHRRLHELVQSVDPSLTDSVERALAGQPGGADASRGGGAALYTVVLDDFHLLTNRQVIDAVGRLAQFAFPKLHMVVSSRQAPRFSSWRQLANGRAPHIDADDLRLTVEEAADIWARISPVRFHGQQMQALTDRTDGWAAGIRLASLVRGELDSLTVRPPPVSGDQRLFADYFKHEVLEGLPAHQVRFLLQSSVLDNLTGEACAAVTGRADADELLDTLHQQHVFLNRVESRHPTYRYAPLFHEYLRHVLLVEMPAIARDCHRRAAGWLQDRDSLAAIDHLIRSGAPDDAFERLTAVVVRRFSDWAFVGQGRSIATDLVETCLQPRPLQTYVLAAACLCDGRMAAGARWLRRMNEVARDRPDADLLRGRAELLWAVRDGLLADADGVLQHHKQASTFLQATHRAERGSTFLPGVGALDAVLIRQLPIFAAQAHLWRGEVADAEAVLRSDLRPGPATGEPGALAVLASLALGEGRLDDAAVLARTVLNAGQRPGRDPSLSCLDAQLTLAEVLYHQDELTASKIRLEEATQLCAPEMPGRWPLAIGCHRALIMLAEGRAFDAYAQVLGLRRGELDEPVPRHLRQKLDQTEIRCRLALGDLGGAMRTLRGAGVDGRTPEVLARLDLAAGRPDRAVDRLSRDLVSDALPRLEIERLLLLARGRLQLGDTSRAEEALHRALDRGRPGRFVRVFLDDALELAPLLIAAARTSLDDHLSFLLSRLATSSRPHAAPAGMLEPLTERERELLSYLESHLSQHEIAEVMYISLNTVKTHIKAIYRKLGVASRSEAVDLARSHQLI